jgi:la-related protein 1
MPGVVAPAAAGFLYSVGAPVFYPPAAYGVSPSLVGMSGTTPVSKLQEVVRTQIDYYFSVPNLVRDVFLRSKMNAEVRARLVWLVWVAAWLQLWGWLMIG